MHFEVGQKVRLFRESDPAWFDTTMHMPQFMALEPHKLLMNAIKKHGLTIGPEGSIGEVVGIDENISMLAIKFESVTLDLIPFACCLVLPTNDDEVIDVPFFELVDDDNESV